MTNIGTPARQQSTLAQARTQDVTNILNPNYNPLTPEDKQLFNEKQKFVYAVFEQKLVTDKGKSLVRLHESTYDAQAVYDELVAHYTKSTKASLDLTQLMQYLTSLRIGDGTWRGTSASFILNFQDKVREFEKMADTSS